jgi:hypothetical protein
MAIMIQASVKDQHGNLYNVKSESDEPDIAWADLGAVLTLIGGTELAQTVRAQLTGSLNGEVRALVPVQVATPSNVTTGPWQQQSQSPQLPAAAQPSTGPGPAPSCPHGQREFISGTSAKTGKLWKAWACPADRDDPSKCDKEWIR